MFSSKGFKMHLCHALFWHRYIDDILFIWKGSTQMLQDFKEKLASNQYSLSFTYIFHKDMISFLDILINNDLVAKITMTLFRKETAGNTILHVNTPSP